MNVISKASLGVFVLLLLLGIGAAFLSKNTETTNSSENISEVHWIGNYQIQIKLNPEKPKIGKNQLTLLIRDEKGQSITDATIELYAEMPAMGSMQAMREVVSIDNAGNGFYQGRYSLPMNGSWPLSISIKTEKLVQAEALFDMNTSRSGVKLLQATASQSTQQPIVQKQKFKEFIVDNYRRQLIGVTTTKVVCQKLVKTINTVAKIGYDQSKIRDVVLQYDAWVGVLNADYLGKPVYQGEALFTVYSPDLVSAQDEYLNGLKQRYSNGLGKAAQKRLIRWGFDSKQIKVLQQRGRTVDYLPIMSPINGLVIEKNIVAGSAAKRGETLLRLADLSTVWVEGAVYESDLPWLKVGMKAQITLPELPDQTFATTVVFIDSVFNLQTHSALIRVELTNSSGLLRPNMFANMQLQVDLGERMVVPEQAVIYSGNQRIVFIDKGKGRLLPRKIKTGVRNKDLIEVVEGLVDGDIIVTSGNFLIAAESKMKAGLAQW